MKKETGRPVTGLLLKSLLRRRVSSLTLVAVLFAATFAGIILYGLQGRQEAAIGEMVANTQIRCLVTNAKGSGVDDLNVMSAYVNMLTGRRHSRGCYLDEYVKDLRAMSREELPSGTWLYRVYTQDSDPDLQEISGNTVTYHEGWSGDCFSGAQPVCLVTGDLLDFVEDGYITVTRKNGTALSLEVIGVVIGQVKQRIYCPFYLPWGEDEAFLLTSCSFSIGDNARLEESKKALYEYFRHPDPAVANDPLTAGLLVQDEIYLKSLEKLRGNLTILRIILPVLVSITGCVGFLSGYLSNRRRKKEFAVMRCIGVSRRGVFLQVFSEQAILALVGCILGVVLGMLLGETFSPDVVAMIALILAVDLLGAALAALQISSVNVMKLMKVEE